MKDEDMLKLMKTHESALGDAYRKKEKKITIDLNYYMEMFEVVYSGIMDRKMNGLNNE